MSALCIISWVLCAQPQTFILSRGRRRFSFTRVGQRPMGALLSGPKERNTDELGELFLSSRLEYPRRSSTGSLDTTSFQAYLSLMRGYDFVSSLKVACAAVLVSRGEFMRNALISCSGFCSAGLQVCRCRRERQRYGRCTLVNQYPWRFGR